jgi:hypothetical protein
VPDQKTIAKALLRGKLPSREIAGLIYDEVDISQPVAMQTPPPIENVEKAAKKSVVKAGTAVMSKVPEYAGRAVVQHRSKSLKRIYIEHGEDQETLQNLCDVVENENRGSTSETWAEKVDLAWLENWFKTHGTSWSIAEVVGRRLMEAKRYGTIGRWKHKNQHLRGAFLGGAMAYGIKRNDVKEVEALLATMKTPKAQKDAIWAGWDAAGGIVNKTTLHLLKKYHKSPKELESRLCESGCFAAPDSEEHYTALLELMPAEGLASDIIDIDLAERYIEATLRHANYDFIRRIIESRIEAVRDESRLLNKEENEQSHRVIIKGLEALARFEPKDGDDGISGIFGESSIKLSGEAVYQALRFGSASATWDWFCDEVNPPDTETFHRLLQKPGLGLPVKRDGSIDWGVFHTEGVLNDFCAILKLPFVDELIEKMGRHGTEMLLDEAEMETHSGIYGTPEASNYLAQKFTKHLGDNLEAWRWAINLLPKSTQPLERTLRGVAKLYKISAMS